MTTQCVIWCKFRFTAIHCWKEATGASYFLRHPHRHEFHVKAGMTVTSLDREIEFIELKRKMKAYCKEAYEDKEFEYSCEEIAMDLIETFGLSFCEVSEDGENGASIVKVKDYEELR